MHEEIISQLADALAQKHGKEPKGADNGYMTHCPCHDDENGSFSLSLKDGRIVWYCHAGCDQTTVSNSVQTLLSQFGYTSAGKEIDKIYQYHDIDGKIILEKIRYKNPKSFVLRRPDGTGGYIYKNATTGIDKNIVYRLPQVQKAITDGQTIYIAEGEKDCDALAALDLMATCNLFGASQDEKKPKWADQNALWLKGATSVVIFPDNDKAGKAHAQAIELSLLRLGISCKIVEVPGLPDKGDISDWLAAGGTKEQLFELIEKAPKVKSNDRTENKQDWQEEDDRTEDSSSPWPEIKPLFREIPPGRPFPVDALGPLAPAAQAIAQCCQVPLAMAGQAVQAAVSLVAQSHVDYMIDGRRRPVSLFLGTGAESGGRKTTADETAMAPINEAEKRFAEDYETLIRDALTEQEIWQAEKQKIKNSKTLSQEDKRQQLKDLGPEPMLPAAPTLTLDDVTIEGIRLAYSTGRASLGVCTSEGATFINSWAMSPEQQMRTAATISKLWDGQPMKVARGGEGVIILDGRRLSVNLFMQPEILRELLSNTKLINQGFISRYLIVLTEYLGGTRLYDEANSLAGNLSYRFYKNKMLELALLAPKFKDKSRLPGVLDTRPLEIAANAKELWVRFYNSVESELRSTGKLFDVRGFGAKAPEHALRLAGIQQFYLKADSGAIDIESTAGGIELVEFYISEQQRLLALGAVPENLQSATRLLDWLKARRGRNGESLFSLVEVYHRGPNDLRTKAKAHESLSTLAEHGYIRPTSKSITYRDTTCKNAWEIRSDV